MKTVLCLFDIIRWPLQAFVCMTIHRNQKIVHVKAREHLIRCQTCKLSEPAELLKCYFLTILYFNRSWYILLLFVPIVIAGAAHKFITGRDGKFVHPPNHGNTIMD
jgi:hypothetical protein